MFLFYSYNFTLDFNEKRTVENRIQVQCVKVLTFLASEAS